MAENKWTFSASEDYLQEEDYCIDEAGDWVFSMERNLRGLAEARIFYCSGL